MVGVCQLVGAVPLASHVSHSMCNMVCICREQGYPWCCFVISSDRLLLCCCTCFAIPMAPKMSVSKPIDEVLFACRRQDCAWCCCQLKQTLSLTWQRLHKIWKSSSSTQESCRYSTFLCSLQLFSETRSQHRDVCILLSSDTVRPKAMQHQAECVQNCMLACDHQVCALRSKFTATSVWSSIADTLPCAALLFVLPLSMPSAFLWYASMATGKYLQVMFLAQSCCLHSIASQVQTQPACGWLDLAVRVL